MKISLKVAVLVALAPFAASSQSIEITSVPPAGQGGYAVGLTHNVDRAIYGVAVYINVFGSWWTKPTFASPLTPINEDGSFSANITTGGQDACAQTVAAYIVPLNTDTGAIQASGQGTLPAALNNVSIAHVSVPKTTQTTIQFAGRMWTLKDTGNCQWGPGPNYFAGNQVRVDANGKLHLSITYTNNAWRCAELFLNEPLGCGTYRFDVETEVNSFPDPIVLGFFTWSDDADYSHREIDVEFSNGAVVGAPQNWQFVVQPYYVSRQRYRFSAPTAMTNSTHVFVWSTNLVSFTSYASRPTIATNSFVSRYGIEGSITGTLEFYPPGSAAIPAYTIGEFDVNSPTNLVVTDPSSYLMWPKFYRAWLETTYRTGTPPPFEGWSTQSGIPQPGNEAVHLNLWLFNGAAPGDTGQQYEVVISNFTFTPDSIDTEKLRPRLKLLKVQEFQKDILFTYPGN